MVVFTCNNCGESLQKPKVAKHYQFQCRRSENLTCVDCHKDFYGQEYVAHTKCITESERYGGQDYVAKPGQNKGERKQQDWINVVKNVIETAKNLTNEERNVLNILSRHENIPRKKAKFLNFINSVMGNRFGMSVIDSIWSKMETAFKATVESNKPQKPAINGKVKEEIKEGTNDPNPIDNQENNVAENQNNENMSKENESLTENGTDVTVAGKKKKSKKRDSTEINAKPDDEPPRKKNKKKIVQEIVEDATVTTTCQDDNETEPPRKKNKKKNSEEIVEDTTITTTCQDDQEDESPRKKNKKKRAEEIIEDAKIKITCHDDKEDESTVKKNKKKIIEEIVEDATITTTCQDDNQENAKFDWKATILEIVGSSEVITMKKLRKKVSNRYVNHCSNSMTFEKASMRFDKKLPKITEISVNDDKVRLS